jgi:cytochrome b561
MAAARRHPGNPAIRREGYPLGALRAPDRAAVLGWIGTSAYRAPIVVFGLFELPPIWPEDRPVSDWVLFVHGLVAVAIAGLLAAHIGAALHHHIVRKDGILMRMITG